MYYITVVKFMLTVFARGKYHRIYIYLLCEGLNCHKECFYVQGFKPKTLRVHSRKLNLAQPEF